MQVDDEDFKIVLSFFKLDEEMYGDWEMMRRIYPKGVNREFKRIFYSKLPKLSNYGLFIISKKKGKPKYVLIKENVEFGKFKFKNKTSIAIELKIHGKWNRFEL